MEDSAKLADRGTVKRLFLEAVDIPGVAERAAFLDANCGGDARLRRQVEALLQAHDQPDSVLDEPVVRNSPESGTHGGNVETEAISLLAPPQKNESLGHLDHYAFLEIIGHGSMGVVFRAFDEKLSRVVAVKMLSPRLAASEVARERFVREARATAAVSNDHVISIHAVEAEGAVPYLVMQYVHGKTLQQAIDESRPVELARMLRIGMQIAEGLAAAHQQGLVHRDIKPANILLENQVERVKITDFGLARGADDSGLAQSGPSAGTPTYMSPEQAVGGSVDYRSDLFSLGSVLYTMCAGRVPFDSGSTLAVLGRIIEDSPPPLRDLNPAIPEWLVALIGRLMARAPADRFQSAAEVAAVLRGHLSELQNPRAASHPRKAVAWASMAILVVAIGGAVAYHQWRAPRAATPMRDAISSNPSPRRVPATPMPEAIELARRPAAADALDRESIPPGLLTAASRGGPTVLPPELVGILGTPSPDPGCTLHTMAVSPDGKTLATAGVDKIIRLWDVATGALRMQLNGHQATGGFAVYSVVYNPQGTLLASGDHAGTIRLWDSSTGTELSTAQGERVTQMAFSPDGTLLAVAAEGTGVQLRHIPDLKAVHRLATKGDSWAITFTPDGQTLAYGDSDIVRFCDVRMGSPLNDLPDHTATIRWIGYRPDGQSVLTIGTHPQRNLFLRLWDANTLEETDRLVGHTQTVLTAAWRADGQVLASAGETEGLVRLWDMTSKPPRCKTIQVMPPGLPWLNAVAFSPEGRHLFVSDPNGLVYVLRLGRPGEAFQIPKNDPIERN